MKLNWNTKHFCTHTQRGGGGVYPDKKTGQVDSYKNRNSVLRLGGFIMCWTGDFSTAGTSLGGLTREGRTSIVHQNETKKAAKSLGK